MAVHALTRAAAAALLVAAGCSTTEVVVVVHNSGLDIGNDVDALSLVIRDRDDGNRVYYSLGRGSEPGPPTPQPLCKTGDSKDCYVSFTPPADQTYKIEVKNMIRKEPHLQGRNRDNTCTLKWEPAEKKS